MNRLDVLFQRPDFRRNPATAIWRRLVWKTRWLTTLQPWTVTLVNGIRMALPKGGAGALIYYQGFSEPETADLILKFLKPGMVFLDLGAHVGEVSLLAAQAVGSSGEVHAFEANPEIFDLLVHNLRLNDLRDVFSHNCAVSDQDGEMEFEIYSEPSVCALRVRNPVQDGPRSRKAIKVLRVPTVQLDTYLNDRKKKVDLVKIDVEGAELLVFLGAARLLGLPKEQSPTFIFEYESNNYARFGYRGEELFELLRRNDYEIWRYSGASHLVPLDSQALPDNTVNLVACKDENCLRQTLNLLQE